jgi:DNA-directed RNA polymerase specialized sigma24 family protein
MTDDHAEAVARTDQDNLVSTLLEHLDRYQQAQQAQLDRMEQAQAERLERLERQLQLSAEKESYTTEEAAERLDKSEWTVRQWCNRGQAQGRKVPGGGRQGEWRIGHAEVVRLQGEGPSPKGTFDNGRDRRAA